MFRAPFYLGSEQPRSSAVKNLLRIVRHLQAQGVGEVVARVLVGRPGQLDRWTVLPLMHLWRSEGCGGVFSGWRASWLAPSQLWWRGRNHFWKSMFCHISRKDNKAFESNFTCVSRIRFASRELLPSWVIPDADLVVFLFSRFGKI